MAWKLLYNATPRPTMTATHNPLLNNPLLIEPISTTLSRDDFVKKIQSLGDYYHIHHPLHTHMSSGQCDRYQLQGWVLNRFYYQAMIPKKDAFILTKTDDRAFRIIWRQRILDHDGDDAASDGASGGIEAWLALACACGLDKKTVANCNYVLPAVRFAVDAYVNFVRDATWHEAVCSSLTELFAPEIHQNRLANWPEHYPFIDQSGFVYFKKRLSEARRDVEHGLSIVLDQFDSVEKQNRALEIIQFKLDVLWSISDAIYRAYIDNMPPYNRHPHPHDGQ